MRTLSYQMREHLLWIVRMEAAIAEPGSCIVSIGGTFAHHANRVTNEALRVRGLLRQRVRRGSVLTTRLGRVVAAALRQATP